MMKVDLNGSWKMKKVQDKEWIEATVPGSVLWDLLAAEKIPDPFYRDNEDFVKEWTKFDYQYEREFHVDSKLMACDRIVLSTKGLDTLADLFINGESIITTDNMHRSYEVDIKPNVQEGSNTIAVTFFSPTNYTKKLLKEFPDVWNTLNGPMPGISQIRKAHYMFGWDWGPQLPDMGIWRDIAVEGYENGRLEDIYITQHHKDGEVTLMIDVKVSHFGDRDTPLEGEVHLTDPSGKKQVVGIPTVHGKEQVEIQVENPQLWWPNGYGKQPLYEVEVLLKYDDTVIDCKEMKIGLRTIEVNREKDEWGEAFEFVVNGVDLFAMGANYIPEDNLLTRKSGYTTENLIQDCVDANFNCIRVWGGGIYPSDHFYDLCDEYGLIVWQDFMFACATYQLTDEFKETVKEEAVDNIRRLRHHASLGLWCGNNEMEEAWEGWDFPKPDYLREDYLELFEKILPEIVKREDPNTFYWPASPSSGGGFDDPNDPNRGDVHYWQVWHGKKPFTEYRNFYFRFCSEFGFESLPSMKTIEEFTVPEDRNLFSHVMEKHQKNEAGNGLILHYLSQYLKYPEDFESLVYASQVLQAEAIKYGVEHWRRHRGRCMGSTYWQMNDCWPVSSWSSVDYYGRWKALHYAAKKFYAPVLLSCEEEGTEASLTLTNDTRDLVVGDVHWQLCSHDGTVLSRGSQEVEVEALSAKKIVEMDFTKDLKRQWDSDKDEVEVHSYAGTDGSVEFDNGSALRKTYLHFYFEQDGNILSEGTTLFVPPKHFDWLDPKISVNVEELEDQFVVRLTSSAFVKFVFLDLTEADCKFNNNYFDLVPHREFVVSIWKESLSKKEYSLADLKRQLKIQTVYDLEVKRN
ncbi:beta-mannosidase [Evansella tamaricis]|uniref:Beta-mannosidase B n=1 Tax=Evansella tamaricis TaxID=2069301 RepID=A0ABS6JGD7_9BACI|nr:glycoside hydrolase family 2 protein [Evansella tamaricis]MBU9712744.1 glycoside hydrolase family 2 protein [Evansella tamaricis]